MTNMLCSLATWQPGMADLSGTNKITLANITVEAEGIGPQIRGALEQEMTRIFRLFGPSAFENTKEAAAVHEAGHVVIYFLLGFRVKVAQIAVSPSGGWIGYTATHEREYLARGAPNVAAALKVARSLYAGYASERLFDPDFREGSSIDEILMSQITASMAAQELNVPEQEYWSTEVHGFVHQSLAQHQLSVRAVAYRLLQRYSLKGHELAQLCSAVKAQRSAH